jgi:uncharacterized protein YndB with AHSA1/START domain
MTVAEAQRLKMTRRFDASPERLFDAWTDPHLADGWLFTGPDSESHSAEMDLRVGGKWKVADRRGGVDYTAIGEYLEIDRPRRLAFTFGMPQFSPAFDRVSIDIAADGKGAVMTLIQEGLPPEHIAATVEGWGKMFDALSGQLVHGGYGVRTAPDQLRFERLLPGPIERVWAYLTDPQLRGQWFAGGPMELAPGGKMTLTFHHSKLAPAQVQPPERYQAMKDGVSVYGIVLACEPPRLLAFRWGEDDGADEARFELAPAGDQVRLTLTHSKLKTSADMANVAAGWQTHLSILLDKAAGREPRPFWSIWKGLEAEYEQRLVVD